MRVAPLSNSYMVLAVTPRASPNCSLLIPRAILRNRNQTAYLEVDWIGHSERQKGFRREVNSDFWKLPLRRLTVRISDFVSPSKGTFERLAFSTTEWQRHRIWGKHCATSPVI
jgi:hypothetical protein